MNILTAVGIFAVLLVIALIAFIATRPDTFRVERSGRMNAPADVVFSLINDFHEWTRWSPWENRDPALKSIYEGPSAGPGAIYSWIGNRNVGEGRMTILESKASEFISIKLEFIKPFAATNQALFKLTPSGGGTGVHWSMEGKNTLMGKVFSLFMSMDKMIGGDFEKGLAGLDTAAQAESQKRRQAAQA